MEVKEKEVIASCSKGHLVIAQLNHFDLEDLSQVKAIEFYRCKKYHFPHGGQWASRMPLECCIKCPNYRETPVKVAQG